MHKPEKIKAAKLAILKKARKTLRSMPITYSIGICYCLSSAVPSGSSQVAHEARRQLSEYVMNALGNHAYLKCWLRAKRRKTDDEFVRSARLAWIDWMIASLEGKN
jgi:hypothetical protein